MPQKWVCQCGTHAPVAQSYCGKCGVRWDRVLKRNPKPKTTDKAAAQACGRQFQYAISWLFAIVILANKWNQWDSTAANGSTMEWRTS